MKTTKLSDAQRRMLLAASAAGGRLQWTAWGMRDSGRLARAWDRTADSLAARELLTAHLSTVGGRAVTLTDAGRALAQTLVEA